MILLNLEHVIIIQDNQQQTQILGFKMENCSVVQTKVHTKFNEESSVWADWLWLPKPVGRSKEEKL